MALKIDEQWVRQRVHLKHDNLDDVKSLSLPGSYHEKITHLGTSLHSFTRLKHLDLSRNSICNLEGIGHLHMLETLNLYYNNISTLKDLYLLRSLVNLKELDIRLNPVTKNEPDHRLFLVHMLPNLKKLDDRSVRDSERKAALMHFSTDQASEFTEERLFEPESNEKLIVPRAELVRSLGPRAVLENDDVLLLDTLSKQDGDPVRPITGSSNKLPDVQDYKKQELCDMYSKENKTTVPEGGKSPPDRHPPSIQFVSNTRPPAASHAKPPKGIVEPSLAPYSVQGNFTPTPKHSTYYEAAEHESDEYRGATRQNGVGDRGDVRETSGGLGRKEFAVDQRPGLGQSEERFPHRFHENGHSTSRGQGSKKEADMSTEYHKTVDNNEFLILHQLVDLVDKYWNGSKSLHRHSKFKELAGKLLRSYQPASIEPQRDTSQLQREIKVKDEELARLSEHFAQQQEECRAIREDLDKERIKHRQFETANEELVTLHERFKETQEENRSLKATIESQKGVVVEREKQSDEVLVEHRVVQEENQTLRLQLDQQSKNLQQLNELTNMLQESHRSLVATNDHLLLELAQEKDRHQNEVNQLHWSYKQLKKSIDWIPSVDKGHKT